ncbi:hypothetical protein PFICI_04727 [Pestalotiopsis fici W106-1]|uniref:Rhodopsin domain-containing protein n=1 Tax=Pestalotiopsis fici (strain W106-1 / CGMCC3.15140) TaxID=1229662 RepID=W3XCE9_PESFW|nr:uncharacterized protein PFICI_04727 [Pestalotiopsis fici W106-1]ETS82851.1 hypothetical protein PFICI_04727 [Pestalotiopsis fici W106-1]
MGTEVSAANLAKVQAAVTETWTLYAFGSLAIVLRVYSRTRLVGLAGYHADDYLVWFGWVSKVSQGNYVIRAHTVQICYTIMTVAAHIVGATGDTSYLGTESDRLSLVQDSPDEAAQRQLGTKWFLIGWFTYIGLIWTLKMNMLFLYQRIVGHLWVRKSILPAMIIVGTSAIAMWVLLATACRPFNHLWQIYPDPGAYCFPQSSLFLITILVVNLVTDFCILLIPIPIIIPLKVSPTRKVGLTILFGAGIFTMVAAILRVHFVVEEHKGEEAAIWSCREDIVAIMIGQATMIRPFFTTRFWGSNPRSSSYQNKPSNGESNGNEVTLQTIGAKRSRPPFWKLGDPYDTTTIATVNESEEVIMGENLDRSSPMVPNNTDPSGISVKHTIEQTTSTRDHDSDRRPEWIGNNRWSPV